MTIFDLIFLLSCLALIVTIARVLYLFARGRSSLGARALRRLSGLLVVYTIALFTAALVQPAKTVGIGVPVCFDDFCVAIDSAARWSRIGDVARGDFVVVSGRVISKAGGRRQREPDVYGVLLDGTGNRYRVSDRGEAALRRIGLAGANLTDFVDPMSANAFKLAFEVPADARSLAFITGHGVFPNALIIGNAQSPFHKPVMVPLCGGNCD